MIKCKILATHEELMEHGIDRDISHDDVRVVSEYPDGYTKIEVSYESPITDSGWSETIIDHYDIPSSLIQIL